MMMVIFAWKNIWRNKKRSVIILAATAIGLTCGVFIVGVYSGMYDAMVETSINRGLGHIQIHSVAFKKDQLLNQSIANLDSVVQIIQHNHNVQLFSTHTVIEGMVSSATVATGAAIVAVTPDAERTVTSISRSIIHGAYLNTPNSIVVGKKLAERLKVKLRSRVVISFSGLDGNIIYGAFRISGIYQTEASSFDGMNVFIKQDDLSTLLGTNAPIHEILLRVRSSATLEQTAHEIQQKIPTAVVETWKELAPEVKLTSEIAGITNLFILGIILFALLFGLTNTLLMSVLDRVRDFGVLLAIGMYRRRLFSLIILESLFLSFSGGIIGIAAGWGLTQYFGAHGIDLSLFSDGLTAYGIPTLLYPVNKLTMYVSLTIMMVATSIIAALYPALKAVRLKPVEAIRTIA